MPYSIGMQFQTVFTVTFAKNSNMDLAACIVPAAPIRKKPSHKSEMVNQLLFGETMRIIEAKKNWWKIQSVHDNYEGWIRNNLLVTIETIPESKHVVVDITQTLGIRAGKMLISLGCSLPGFAGGKGKIGEVEYEYSGTAIDRTDTKANDEMIRQLTSRWLNAPYLWGGRTPLGVDCSGFVQ